MIIYYSPICLTCYHSYAFKPLLDQHIYSPVRTVAVSAFPLLMVVFIIQALPSSLSRPNNNNFTKSYIILSISRIISESELNVTCRRHCETLLNIQFHTYLLVYCSTFSKHSMTTWAKSCHSHFEFINGFQNGSYPKTKAAVVSFI